MDAKKVINFLILRPAFTSRNLTSIGLVVLFFLVYVLSGGKVTWAPNVKNVQNAGFGGVMEGSGGSAPADLPRASMKQDDPFANQVAPQVPVPGSENVKPAEAPLDLEPEGEDRESGLANIRERLEKIGK